MIFFREPVLGQVKWAESGQLVAVWMNRVQNEMDIITCFMDSSECKTVISNEIYYFISKCISYFSNSNF